MIRFGWKYLIYQDRKRKVERIETKILQSIDFTRITSRQKQQLKANKEKIRRGQPSHSNGMITGYRKKILKARKSSTKLYLGGRNVYGLRDILNGQSDAAERCELIIDPTNVKRINVTGILEQLK